MNQITEYVVNKMKTRVLKGGDERESASRRDKNAWKGNGSEKMDVVLASEDHILSIILCDAMFLFGWFLFDFILSERVSRVPLASETPYVVFKIFQYICLQYYIANIL
jgi:hypothetical protein